MIQKSAHVAQLAADYIPADMENPSPFAQLSVRTSASFSLDFLLKSNLRDLEK